MSTVPRKRGKAGGIAMKGPEVTGQRKGDRKNFGQKYAGQKYGGQEDTGHEDEELYPAEPLSRRGMIGGRKKV